MGQIVLLVIKSYYTKKQAEHAIQEALLLHAPWSFKQSTLLCWLVSLTPPDTQKKHIPSLEFRKIIDSKLRFDGICYVPGGYNPPVMPKVYHGLPGKPLEVLSFFGVKLQLNFGQVVWSPLIVD